MGIGDKARHSGEQAKGKAKETAGKASGDDKLKNEGKGDQASAKVKKVGEAAKDVFK